MKQTMTRRFYTTAISMDGLQMLINLGEAVNKAKYEVENGKFKEYYVVEIVRIVRRVDVPVEVIEVI